RRAGSPGREPPEGPLPGPARPRATASPPLATAHLETAAGDDCRCRCPQQSSKAEAKAGLEEFPADRAKRSPQYEASRCATRAAVADTDANRREKLLPLVSLFSPPRELSPVPTGQRTQIRHSDKQRRPGEREPQRRIGNAQGARLPPETVNIVRA